jgi:signal transduction histidine kinase
MEALLTDLLDLSRIGRVEADVEDVDLADIALEIGLATTAAHPRVVLDIDAKSMPVVRMNASRARQLLTNLVENAARHGGRADLSVRLWSEHRSDGGSVIHVQDDGVGIPPEYRESVFGMFERLPSPYSEARGTGLGLAMCRRIVESIGGEIELVYKDGDRGVHVRISLPTTAFRTSASSRAMVAVR